MGNRFATPAPGLSDETPHDQQDVRPWHLGFLGPEAVRYRTPNNEEPESPEALQYQRMNSRHLPVGLYYVQHYKVLHRTVLYRSVPILTRFDIV